MFVAIINKNKSKEINVINCEKLIISPFITFYIDKKSKLLKKESCVILGNIFDKDFKIASEIDESKIEDYYGDFLYFGFSNQELRIYTSQDLESKIFFSKDSDGYIFASSMELLFQVKKEEPKVNWAYMISFIKHGNLCPINSPFLDVFEIPFGCMLILNRISYLHEIVPVWRPRDTLQPKEEWIDSFLNRLQHTFETIPSHKKVLLELSGGLDSSLLCCLLAKYKDKFEIQAVNHYNEKDANSDERFYANRVASYFDIPLTYFEGSKSLPFGEVSFFYKPNRPSATFHYHGQDTRVHQLARSFGEDYLIVSGHGSDSLFFSAVPIETIVDAYICEGYRTALSKLNELRNFYPNPYLHDIKTCLKVYWKYLAKKKFSLPDQISPCRWLLGQEMINFYDYQHPLFTQTKKERMLPGKALLMENAYVTLASTERQLPTLYPFLSKQVIESAFAIPTYESFDREHNRVWVRSAFAKLADPILAYRKSKGTTTAEFFKGIKENYQNILSLCMEGQFVKNGFANKETLHQDIKGMREGIMEKAVYISNLFCAELFLREWEFD